MNKPTKNKNLYYPTIFVVMAVHNRKEITRQCLKQLNNQTYSKLKIIIIDDGSTDGTSQMIKTQYPDIHLLHGDGSYWWSKSMNMGIDAVLKIAATNDLVLTMNDDTDFNHYFVETFYKESLRYPNSLIGSLNLIKMNIDRIFSAGGRYDLLFSNHKANYPIGIPYNDNLIEGHLITDYLPGRGTLIPVKTFREIGYYDDERFPQYIADEEFSFRAKLKGYNCIVSSQIKLYVDTNSTGLNFVNEKIDFKLFYKSLTAINSTNNLKSRANFAYKHSKYPLVYIIFNYCRLFIKSFIQIIFKNII